MNRFKNLLAIHEKSMREQHRSAWIPVEHTMHADGTQKISCLKNPTTGEVVSDQGWES